MRAAISTLLGLAMLGFTAGCGPDPERNIIVDGNLFYKKELPYREGSEGEIVSTVKAFAREHSMDYLGGPGHPTLDPGEFNLIAASRSLNLKALRGIPISPHTEVVAIARRNPTANDKALTAEFVCRLEKSCGSGGNAQLGTKAR